MDLNGRYEAVHSFENIYHFMFSAEGKVVVKLEIETKEMLKSLSLQHGKMKTFRLDQKQTRLHQSARL